VKKHYAAMRQRPGISNKPTHAELFLPSYLIRFAGCYEKGHLPAVCGDRIVSVASNRHAFFSAP